MIKRAGGSDIRIIARSIIIRAPTLTMSADKLGSNTDPKIKPNRVICITHTPREPVRFDDAAADDA